MNFTNAGVIAVAAAAAVSVAGCAGPTEIKRAKTNPLIVVKGHADWRWEGGEALERKTKFKAAEAVLDSGYRYFHVYSYVPRQRVTKQTTIVPGVGWIVGQPEWGGKKYETTTVSKNNDILEIGLELVEGKRLAELRAAKDSNLKDAVEEYNRLGAEMDGSGFKPRTEPSPRVAPAPAPRW